MKKFYKLVSTQPEQDGFGVRLDGKPLKTPGGKTIKAATASLAQAIAQEWGAQQDIIDPEAMPLTQIAVTAMDRIADDRPAIAAQALAYLDTDLLCYRAVLPAGLAERQALLWDPWLAWFAQRYGAALATTTGLQALRQPAAAVSAVEKYAAELDDEHFCVLQLVTALSGSLVLALAFCERAASCEDVFAAANAEEVFKAGIYNEAVHGGAPQQEKKQRAMRRDLEAAARYLDLLAD